MRIATLSNIVLSALFVSLSCLGPNGSAQDLWGTVDTVGKVNGALTTDYEEAGDTLLAISTIEIGNTESVEGVAEYVSEFYDWEDLQMSADSGTYNIPGYTVVEYVHSHAQSADDCTEHYHFLDLITGIGNLLSSGGVDFAMYE